MKYVLYVLLALLIYGCSAEKKVSSNGEPITIGGDELSVSQPTSGGDKNEN